MTQIVVTLENGADSNFFRRMIENMKGVLDVSVKTHNAKRYVSNELWIHKMEELAQKVDKSAIDLNDERTKYILSK